jgi:hypothetical protein
MAASSKEGVGQPADLQGKSTPIIDRAPILSAHFQALFVVSSENGRPAFAGLSWS